MTEKRKNSLNEALKRQEAARRQPSGGPDNGGKTTPPEPRPTRVLSPGRLVSRRFFKNKLALAGLSILLFMFLFSFLGPLFYGYSQTQIFYKYDKLNIDYASAAERTSCTSYPVDAETPVHYAVENGLNAAIQELEKSGQTQGVVRDPDGKPYVVQKLRDKVYTLSAETLKEIAVYTLREEVAVYHRLSEEFSWTDGVLDAAFQSAAAAAVLSQAETFDYGGDPYAVAESAKNTFSITRETPALTGLDGEAGEALLSLVNAHPDGVGFHYNGDTCRVLDQGGGIFSVCAVTEATTVRVSSPYVFNACDPTREFSDAFKAAALTALGSDGTFSADGKSYTLSESDDNGVVIRDTRGTPTAYLGTFVVRRASGRDTLSIPFKEEAQAVIRRMRENHLETADFTFSLPVLDETADPVYDDDGRPLCADTRITVTEKSGRYVLSCEQPTYLIDIFAPPSSAHLFGTDGDGMDILARMMYGGRISLLVGFVVILLETLIGVVLGGAAGFFGGWVDSLIMRLVDVFYCIPSLPILIILGAFLDAMKVPPYQRLVWLMAILGILGWAGVARLVRGQILSLRQQEFMLAEEAAGLRASRRIFRHLIPNVMPQLIVNATMGLGSVIITESTLSFLGLGVKHPLATWGTMINAVAGSAESMIHYTYIWIPVGLLICLTVIAFNFVGDGLRDAFDPKMT